MSTLLLFTLASAAPVPAQDSGTPSAAVAAAEAAAEEWLALIDQQRHGESWENAAAPFRSAVSRSQWERAVVQARRGVSRERHGQ